MTDPNPYPGSTAQIEPATWHDFNAVRQLEKVCFPKDAWPLFDVIGVLSFPGVVRYKATVGGMLVGFAAVDQRANDPVAWIATVAVLPEFRHQGIGEALMTACEKGIQAPAVRLSVRASNQEAIRLYLRLGYVKIGLWPEYYADRENAVVMEKQLD